MLKEIKEGLFWTGIGFLVLGSILSLYFFSKKQTISTISKEPPPVKADDWTKGNPQAENILIEYSDFQCPACRIYHPIIQQLIEKYPDQILFVYRHFPLIQIHQNAELAARAAESAGKQGKFWEMHNLLFERQDEWAKSSKAEELFIQYAQSLNLDVQKFVQDLNSEEIKKKTQKALEEAISLGLNSTPTFFLNGKQITPSPSLSSFESLLQLNK